jgi:hypothetical protein
MMRVWVEAVATWSAAPGAGGRPAPRLLGPAERRRAPDAVLIAIDVAERAAAAAGREPAGLASVFASAHGDLAVVDALCRTLASDPMGLSPTRFHNSVHNAPSGYWAIAARSHAPSTALSAYDHSFAAGWLEAVCLCLADRRPVLLVGVDTEAGGPLASVNASRGRLGVAIVLAPAEGPRARSVVDTALVATAAKLPDPGGHPAAANALADALPLVAALEREPPTRLRLPLGPALALELHCAPAAGA